jgi:hypothetical protein
MGLERLKKLAEEIEILKRGKTDEIADCIIEMVDELHQECLSKKPRNVSVEKYIEFFSGKFPYSCAVVNLYPYYREVGEKQEIWVGYRIFDLGFKGPGYGGLLGKMELGSVASKVEESIDKKLERQATKTIPRGVSDKIYETPNGKYGIFLDGLFKFLSWRRYKG